MAALGTLVAIPGTSASAGCGRSAGRLDGVKSLDGLGGKMTLSEAEAYSKMLRKAGFYATPMWHWGNSSYSVVIANKLMVVSTRSEMVRWMDMYRVERLINEREQAEQESRDIHERSRSFGIGDDR